MEQVKIKFPVHKQREFIQELIEKVAADFSPNNKLLTWLLDGLNYQ